MARNPGQSEQAVISVNGEEYPCWYFPNDGPTLAPVADGYNMALLSVPVAGINHMDPVPTRDTGKRDPGTKRRVLELVEAWQAASLSGLSGVTHTGGGMYRVEDGSDSVLLDLYRIRNPQGHHLALRAFLERDAAEFNCAACNNIYTLGLVLDNWQALKSRGMLEPCLAEAWTLARSNNAGHPAGYVADVMRACDRDKLQSSRDPLPDGDRFQLYRGVSGTHPYRRVNGLAWTDSLGCACWFAVRYEHLERPEVVTANVARDDIFFYTNGRQEREYVTRPKSYRKLGLTVEDMKAHAKAWRDSTKD